MILNATFTRIFAVWLARQDSLNFIVNVLIVVNGLGMQYSQEVNNQ